MPPFGSPYHGDRTSNREAPVLQQIAAVLNQFHAMLVVIALIGIDTLLGWIVALSKGQFTFAKAGQYLETKILPYVGGLVVLAIVVQMYPQAGIALPVSYVAVAAKVAKDIIEKVSAVGISVNFNNPPTGGAGQSNG